MFALTNEQRVCFALAPVMDHWDCVEAKPGPYDRFRTFLYLDGDTIVKCVLSGDLQYCEYELSEKLSPDRKYLLPKTTKGKPKLLSSSVILKCKGSGMRLDYSEKSIRLYNELTECSYYCNSYLSDDVRDLKGFAQWVQGWCADSGEDDIADVLRFSRQQRRHIRYQEGDVFRFKIGRRLYGYGRILLDYDKMRKKKEAFWDILMGKPLVCSVYHMVTDRKDVSVDELSHLGSLPSTIIADNALFYGEYEIIGNLPIGENEDYPVMYGNSISVREKALCYQCGKIYKKIEDGTEIYRNFRNNGVSFRLNLMLDVLLQCSEEASNTPYWTHYYAHRIDQDLRNPKHADKLQKVKEQMGL